MGKKALAWTAAGLGAGLGAAGAYVSARRLVNVALKREDGKESRWLDRQRIRGSREDAPFLEARKKAGDSLRLTPHALVETVTEDSLRLVGHWFPHKHPKRIILAMHGWRSTWALDFGMIAPFWEEEGCSVLYPEQRGQSRSGGDYMGFGMLERYDCLQWLKWLENRCGSKLPVYLAGVSMGATTVLMASGLGLPATVRGIFADCGFTSPHAIWKHVAKHNLFMPYGLRGLMAEGMCRRRLHMDPKACSTVQALQGGTTPVFFAHGKKDSFVPVSMTLENYRACAAPKRLFLVPNAGHGMSYFLEKDAYERAMKQFWQEFDETNQPSCTESYCNLGENRVQ